MLIWRAIRSMSDDANEGERIVTLDEKEFTLNSSNLVICDGVKPVALAGIMGGLNSEIKDTTTEVMFESAKFARDNIGRVQERSDSPPIPVRCTQRASMSTRRSWR